MIEFQELAERGAWLAWLVEHATQSRGVAFEPHTGCREYLKKRKSKEKKYVHLKKIHTSGPVQFKLMLFKDQLYLKLNNRKINYVLYGTIQLENKI